MPPLQGLDEVGRAVEPAHCSHFNLYHARMPPRTLRAPPPLTSGGGKDYKEPS